MLLFLTSWDPKLNMASQNDYDLEQDLISIPNLPSLPSCLQLPGTHQTTRNDKTLDVGTKDSCIHRTNDTSPNPIDLTGDLDDTEINVLEETDCDGDTLLHNAIILCKTQIAQVLVDMIKNEGQRRILNIVNNEWQTPLHVAALTGDITIVLALLKNGADITARDKEGRTFMHILCANDENFSRNSKLREFLLNKQSGITSLLTPNKLPECLRIKNCRGQTCFHVACETGNIGAARCLVDMEDMDFLKIPDSKAGKTGLHVAAENGHTSVVKLLAGRHGVDLERKTYDGMTALIAAYHRGHSNIVGVLRNADAVFSTREIKKFGPYRE